MSALGRKQTLRVRPIDIDPPFPEGNRNEKRSFNSATIDRPRSTGAGAGAANRCECGGAGCSPRGGNGRSLPPSPGAWRHEGCPILPQRRSLIFESGGVERGKKEYASHHLSADAQFSKAVPSKVTRRVGHVAGATAWIATEGRTTGVFKGKAIDRKTVETMILRRTGGSWKIAHIHWSSGPA